MMEIVKVYKCLCDKQRLRILNLLQDGPLCVCHIIEVLNADQVKISKQLKYMKGLGMVEANREANWMIYNLPDPANPILSENLKCLQDCAGEHLCFEQDLNKLRKILQRIQQEDTQCPEVVTVLRRSKP